MVRYQCPLCLNGLTKDNDNRGYTCELQHHFDIAKTGYLNLLPVQLKHSKSPGDNKAMLEARHAFLEAGYFQPLLTSLSNLIKRYCSNSGDINALDLGCGEGFYSRNLAQSCSLAHQINFHGIDIAKFAVAKAAKRQPKAHFVVASVNQLPYPELYFDLIFRVFAPSNDKEIKRVLSPHGLLITVTPGPRHLWQLKEFIYREVSEHSMTANLPADFTLITSERCTYAMTPSADHRLALLQMTPFNWQASEAMHQRIAKAEDLVIEVDFIITLARITKPAV